MDILMRENHPAGSRNEPPAGAVCSQVLHQTVPGMAMNWIQFQRGISLFEHFQHFGTETQCVAALELTPWPGGFRCPTCGWAAPCVLCGSTRKTFKVQSVSSSDLADRRHTARGHLRLTSRTVDPPRG
jgi:hypothetical protein